MSVEIAAQSLRTALDQFAKQTGLQVVYAGAGIVNGERAPAVAGTLPPDAILARLLAPSGLQYKFVNARTVTVFRAGLSHASGEQGTAGTKAGASAEPAAGASIRINPSSAAAKAATLGTITVTGTNLENVNPASPLIVIDAEQIKAGGYSSIVDVLRHLPQNFSSRTSTSQAMGETEYGSSYLPISAIGSDSINLRGLGDRSTLILVNGHRIAGSAQGQGAYTDISSIPLSQVERIEIVTDGASAIYGADAVAGVVNIILKKKYEGTVVEVRRENSSSGADISSLNLAHTFSWDKGFLSLSGSFRKTAPPDVNRFIHKGPAGVGDFSDLGGTDARTPGVGEPGVVFQAVDLGFNFFLPGDALGIIPNGQNGTSLQPGDLLPYDASTAPSVYNSLRIGPKVLTPALRINGEQDLGHDLKFSYSASYARQRNEEFWHPTLYDFNFLQQGTTTLIPASNPYNHFGQDVLVGYSYAKEFAGMTLSEDQKQTNANYNLDLSGKLPFLHGWHFDLSYNQSREAGTADSLGDDTGFTGGPDDQRIFDLLNGLNVFGDGSDASVVDANRALLETLIDRNYNWFNSRLHVFNGLVRGELFSLPAGPVQLALGVQYRDERYHFASTLGGYAESNSKRTAPAEYAELSVPLLKDKAWAEDLRLSFAVRHESFNQRGTNTLVNMGFDYDANFNLVNLVQLGGFDLASLAGASTGDTLGSSGSAVPAKYSYSATSPEVRLSWQINDDLRLRATWGRSFLPPVPEQQFGQESVQLATYAVLFNGGMLPPGVNEIISLNGPNPNLKPQVATTRTLGFDYTPGFAPGLSIAATYNDTSFENFIGDPLSGLDYGQIFSDISKMPKGTFTLGQNGVLLWDARQVNFLGRRSRTIDANVTYGFDTPVGAWNINLDAVRTLKLVATPLPSYPPVVFSNSEFGPGNWAANLLVSWNKGNWFASTQAHYASGFRVMFPLSAQANIFNNFTPSNPNPRYHAGSYTTVDFQAGYRWPDDANWLSRTTLRLGVNNAFNKPFPFVDNQFGFVSNRVNIRGRVVYLDLTKNF